MVYTVSATVKYIPSIEGLYFSSNQIIVIIDFSKSPDGKNFPKGKVVD